MSDNFRWDQEEEGQETPEQVVEEAALEAFEEPAEESRAEESAELSEEEQEAEDTEVLSNARLRLEQGKLYEMLLKHDFFEDVDSDPRAVKNVQREIKNFVKERLEILLGIRQDPKIAVRSAPAQFTELEVSLLKGVLGKLSGGTTARVETPKTIPATRPVSNQIKKLVPPKAIAPKPVVATPKKVMTVNQAQGQPKPKMPVPKQMRQQESDPLYKSPSEMTSTEIEQRNREIAARQAARKAKSDAALPMPSPESQEQLYMSRQMNSKFTQTLAPVINHMLKQQ